MNRKLHLRLGLALACLVAILGLDRIAASSAPPPSTAAVAIVAPASGAVLPSAAVTVDVAVTDYPIGPFETPHIVFFLDNDPEPYAFFNGDQPARFGHQVVLQDFTRSADATWIDEDTLRFNRLRNGVHTLTATLVDAAGEPLGSPSATASVTFTVAEPPPGPAWPDALLFVKEQLNTYPGPVGEPPGMGRVFNNRPDMISDLYLLSPVAPDGAVLQLTDVAAAGGGVTDPEVSFDGERAVFAMRREADENWHIWEIDLQSLEQRQLTFDPPFAGANDQDPAYLPDGRILFASDRLGKRELTPYDPAISTQIYVMGPNGEDIRLLEPNPNFDINPLVTGNGRVQLDRWDHLSFLRNRFTIWDMNPDGTDGFVSYGGVSPRFDQLAGENANGIEHRELPGGEMIGIFTNRDRLPGQMGLFDNRNADLENLPYPIIVGPPGLYRTPYPLSGNAIVYGYTPSEDELHNGFGLYTMTLQPEVLLIDDRTRSTAPGPGLDPAFRTYEIALEEPGRVYLLVAGIADDNGDDPPDRAWVTIDGVPYDGGETDIEQKLDGDLLFGQPYRYRVDADLGAGTHTIHIATEESPTLLAVAILQAVNAVEPTLLYDDPTTNEVSPIPVRQFRLPPNVPERTNEALGWGTFVVRDISLRGDFRQPNYTAPEGDPDYPYHLDLDQIRGLRVFQSQPRRQEDENILVGSDLFDAVRVLGVTEPNAAGTAAFKVFAGNTTAWDLIDASGSAIVHERVWSWVNPGEVRSCGGCHVGAFPYVERQLEPLPEPDTLLRRGEVYSFVDQVLPIFQARCAACHTGPSPAGGLDLTGDRNTFETLVTQTAPGALTNYAVFGEARQSLLFQLLTGRAPDNPINQLVIDAINEIEDHRALLTAEERFDVATWLDTGAGFAYLIFPEQPGGPTVAAVLPTSGSAAVPANSGVAVRFSAPIDRATVDETTLRLIRVGSGPVAGSFVWGGNQDVLFRPAADLTPGLYRLALSGDIRDIKEYGPGYPLAAPYNGTFTVAGSADNTSPGVLSLAPTGPAISPFDLVEVRFTEPIAPGTIHDRSLWVKDAVGHFVDGHIVVAADGRSALLVPWQPWAAGATYRIGLTAAIKDLAGNALSPATHAFTVSAAPLDQPIGLRLDLPTGNDPQRSAVSPDGQTIAVTNRYDDTVTLLAASDGAALATLEAPVDPIDVAFSADGDLLFVLGAGNGRLRILTVPDGQPVAAVPGLGSPDRLRLSPDGARLYVLDTAGTGAIHELDVNPFSPTFGTRLRTLDTGGLVPTDVAVSPDGATLYFSAPFGLNALDLTAETIDTIYLPFGAPGEFALDPDGAYALVAGATSRSLRYVDLRLGEERGEIRLSDDVDHLIASPGGHFVYLVERSTQGVAVLDTAALTVGRRLPGAGGPGTYVRDILVSADGADVFLVEGGLSKNVRVFTLGDPGDSTSPQLTGRDPAPGAIDVPVYAAVRLDFSEPIDRLTVDAQSVRLEGGGAPLSRTLAFAPDNRALWLRPITPLTPGASYQVVVESTITDLAGNPLAPASPSAFTVAATRSIGPFSILPGTYNSNNSYGLALSQPGPPDEAVLAVATRTQDRVSLLRPYDLSEILPPFASGLDRPRGVAFSPAGDRLYVAHDEAGALVEIDPATGAVLRTFAGLVGAEEVAIGPNGRVAYTSGGALGAFNAIDLVTGQVTAPLPDVDRPGRAVFAPDGTLLVPAFGALWRRGPGGGWSAADTGGTLTPSAAVSADGRYAFLLQEWRDSLIVFDLDRAEAVAEIPLGARPRQMTASLDGRLLFVAEDEAGTVRALDSLTLETVADVSLGSGRPVALAWSPTGRLFVSDIGTDRIIALTLGNSVPPP